MYTKNYEFNTVSLLIFVLLSASGQSLTEERSFQANLVKYLKNNITDYSPTLLPNLDAQKPLDVFLNPIVGQIVAVESSKQSIRVSMIIYGSWYNEWLVWNPKEFDNVSVVDWDNSQLWFPVIIIYNGLGDKQLLAPQFPSFITSMSPNKSVVVTTWMKEWEFSCSFNMSRFPYDRHICDMQLFASDQGRGPRTITLKRGFLLAPPSVKHNELVAYVPNSEWKLLNVTVFSEIRFFEFFKELPKIPQQFYVIRIEIERISTYYLLNVVTPLLLLTLLQVLVFFVPVESGEKLGFGITIMLSYTVFLLLLDGLLPKSQSLPAVASFITAAMVLSTSSLLLTSVAIRFHFATESEPMPSCLRAVFVSCLGRLLLCGGRWSARTEPARDSDAVDDKGADGERPVRSSEERRSDWQIAAVAVERLMAIIGSLATVAIFVVFLLAPVLS